MSWSCAFVLSCYGAVQSLSGDAERDIAVEAVGQGECSLYSEDTVTDEEGRFRLLSFTGSQVHCKTGGLGHQLESAELLQLAGFINIKF